MFYFPRCHSQALNPLTPGCRYWNDAYNLNIVRERAKPRKFKFVHTHFLTPKQHIFYPRTSKYFFFIFYSLKRFVKLNRHTIFRKTLIKCIKMHSNFRILWYLGHFRIWTSEVLHAHERYACKLFLHAFLFVCRKKLISISEFDASFP